MEIEILKSIQLIFALILKYGVKQKYSPNSKLENIFMTVNIHCKTCSTKMELGNLNENCHYGCCNVRLCIQIMQCQHALTLY